MNRSGEASLLLMWQHQNPRDLSTEEGGNHGSETKTGPSRRSKWRVAAWFVGEEREDSRLQAREAASPIAWSWKDLAFAVLVVGFFILATSRLDYSARWSYSDHLPLAFSLDSVWSNFIYAWNWRGLGHAGQSGSLFQVVANGLGLASGLPGFDGIAQVALLPLSVITAYIYFRLHHGRLEAAPAALFFALNPLTVASFDGGDGGVSASILLLYLLFPIVFAAVFEINWLVRRRLPRLLALVVVGELIGLCGYNLPLLFWTYSVPLGVALISQLIIQPRGGKESLVNLLVILAAAGPQLFLAFGAISVVAAAPVQYTSAAASGAVFVYRPETLLNLLKVAGSNGNSQSILGYNGSSWWSLIGLVPAGVAMLGFLGRHRKDRHVAWRLTAFGLLVIVAAFVVTIVREGYAVSAMESYSILAALDNVVRVQFWAAVSIAFLMPWGFRTIITQTTRMVESAKRRLSTLGRRRNHIRTLINPSPSKRSWAIVEGALAVVLVVCVLTSNVPALDGTFGMEATRGTAYVLPGRFTALNLLAEEGRVNLQDYRVLWLPYTSSNFQQQALISQYEINAPYEGTYFLPNESSLIQSLYTAVCDYNYTTGFSSVLEALSVRYLVLDFASASTFHPNAPGQSCLVGSSAFFVSIETTSGFLEALARNVQNYSTVYSDNKVTVLGTNYAEPLAYAVSQSSGQSSGTVLPTFFQVQEGNNLLVGGLPADASKWSPYPSASDVSTVVAGNSTGIRLNLTSSGPTTASQILNISSSAPLQIGYDLSIESAGAAMRVLWFNQSAKSLGDGDAMGHQYITASGTIPHGNFSLIVASAVVTPPSEATVAKIELLVGPLSSGSRVAGASATYSQIQVKPVTWVPSSGLVLRTPGTATCGAMAATNHETTLSFTTVGCKGPILVILNTAYSTEWLATVGGGKVGQSPSFVANEFANGWRFNVTQDVLVSIRFAPQERTTYLIVSVVSISLVLPAVLGAGVIYSRRHRRPKLS